MRTPLFVTFTGADDRTSLTRMDAIARAFPVEWALLQSPSDRDARFPSLQARDEMLAVAGRKALHLCGGFAKTAAALRVDPSLPLDKVERIQLNGRIPNRDLLPRLAADFNVDVILQTRGDAFPQDDRCHFLFDASGGRGRIAEVFPPLPSGPKPFGFAGGFGPDTVRDLLTRIDGESDGVFWIDMEGRVRDERGWFDLDKVERVCEIVFG